MELGKEILDPLPAIRPARSRVRLALTTIVGFGLVYNLIGWGQPCGAQGVCEARLEITRYHLRYGQPNSR